MPTGKPTAAERRQKGVLVAEYDSVTVYWYEGTDRCWGIVQEGRLYPWRYATWGQTRQRILEWNARQNVLGYLAPPAVPLRARQNNVDQALEPAQ